MSNITTTIGPSLHTPLVFGFYSDIKPMTFIQDIAVFQCFLAQLNYKLERIKNLISYIGTHITSLSIKFISSNEIFNKNYSYRECNRRLLLNRNNDDIKMALDQIEGMTMFGSSFAEFKAVLNLDAAKGSVKYLKVSF
tara:strand:- start:332 stop:745 length:414 start_codon:yes stop_codon:yes gene_type:complete